MSRLTRNTVSCGICFAAIFGSSSIAFKTSSLRHIGSISRCVGSTARSGVNGNNIADLRVSYSKQGLDETILPSDPHEMFRAWFEEACNAKVVEPNAMCLSTCSDNKPSARFVLLKGHDEQGFVWYTNYNSRKSSELLENPYAALTFWWGDLERSVRIEGRVEQVSPAESDAYFNSRPKGSQIGAWTSNQSSRIEDRVALEKQEAEIMAKFAAMSAIPRPPHWGGFRLVPSKIEFWKGRESRLHDRIVFERKDGEKGWTRCRLQP